MPDQLDPMENIKVISDLDVAERVAYISMYGAEPLEIDMEQLSNAIDMVSDDEAPEDMKALIHGLAGVPALKQMLPARLAVMIETMRAQMPPFDSAEDVRKFADKWVAEPAKREELAKPAADIPRTYDALDLEVALHVMGINPDLAKAADIRNAKDLIQKRDPAWRAWATSLRVITGILRVPRGELWTLMEDGHKNLKLIEDADARRDYVSSKLHGHPLLPDYQPETSQVKNLGDGKFSIEGLTGGATSNDGEKKKWQLRPRVPVLVKHRPKPEQNQPKLIQKRQNLHQKSLKTHQNRKLLRRSPTKRRLPNLCRTISKPALKSSKKSWPQKPVMLQPIWASGSACNAPILRGQNNRTPPMLKARSPARLPASGRRTSTCAQLNCLAPSVWAGAWTLLKNVLTVAYQ